MNERDVVAAPEQRDDLLGLAKPHQAMVDEDAGQLLADRFVDQDGGDRAVDSAGQPADHLSASDLGPNVGDLGIAVARHRPVAGAAADVTDEIGEKLAAVGRVHDLGVEHQAVAPRGLIGRDCERRAFGTGDHGEAGRERFHAVAVAHPHLVLLSDLPQPVEQGRGRGDVDEGSAELLLVGGHDLAAELLVKRLLAIADAEQGTPLSNMTCGARGLSVAVTEAGPPEKMTPLGCSRSNAASAALNGAISQ